MRCHLWGIRCHPWLFADPYWVDVGEQESVGRWPVLGCFLDEFHESVVAECVDCALDGSAVSPGFLCDGVCRHPQFVVVGVVDYVCYRKVDVECRSVVGGVTVDVSDCFSAHGYSVSSLPFTYAAPRSLYATHYTAWYDRGSPETSGYSVSRLGGSPFPSEHPTTQVEPPGGHTS